MNFPIGFDFHRRLPLLNYSTYIQPRSFIQDGWKRENHGSNLMSKFIFTRPVGNVITACIQRISGTHKLPPALKDFGFFFPLPNELRCKFCSERFMLRCKSFFAENNVYSRALKGNFARWNEMKRKEKRSEEWKSIG